MLSKPTTVRESLFGQRAGYARFRCNRALGEFRAGLGAGAWLAHRSLRPRWNRVKGVNCAVGYGAVAERREPRSTPASTLVRRRPTWGDNPGKLKAGQPPGRRVGFPRYKRRKHQPGFRVDDGPDTVGVDIRTVIPPKIGQGAVVEHLRFEGFVREGDVNRTAGTWFALFCI